jgi:hypothetical protein
MSVLDFPSSPTNGQYYNGFVWNAANETWDSSFAPRAATIPLAGTNYVINGGFDIWQRGTSTTTPGFLADRWVSQVVGGSGYTQSRQVLGLDVSQATTNGEFFYRHQHTAGTGVGDYAVIITKIEDVRTLAGKTATLSFWATADSARSLSVELGQSFGTGGSTNVNAIGVTKLNVTTTVARYTVTVNIPSIVGKTVGPNSSLEIYLWLSAGSNFNARTNSLGNQSGAYTFNIWGVELEDGAAPTEFRRHAPSIQGELAACQRYYQRINAINPYGTMGVGNTPGTAAYTIIVPLKVTMRTVPAFAENSALSTLWLTTGGANYTLSSMVYQPVESSADFANISGSCSTIPSLAPLRLIGQNNVNAFVAFSAEL